MNAKNEFDSGAVEEIYYSFEEFRMMYDSTELISDRKISFNRNNASFCLAVIAGQGVVTNWCYQKHGLEVLGPLVVSTIAILGVIFCLYWNGQLWTFKELNGAKFQVLEEMAERLIFPDYKERSVRSISPFAREYQILAEKKELVQSNRGLLLPRSNFVETIVPKSFLVFFASSIFLCGFWLMINLHLSLYN